MPRSQNSRLVLAAAAGLALGAAACKTSADPANSMNATTAAPTPSTPTHGAKACCKGLNDCRGKGGCAVDGKHECAGKNACKNQGGCNMRCPK